MLGGEFNTSFEMASTSRCIYLAAWPLTCSFRRQLPAITTVVTAGSFILSTFAFEFRHLVSRSLVKTAELALFWAGPITCNLHCQCYSHFVERRYPMLAWRPEGWEAEVTPKPWQWWLVLGSWAQHSFLRLLLVGGIWWRNCIKLLPNGTVLSHSEMYSGRGGP